MDEQALADLQRRYPVLPDDVIASVTRLGGTGEAHIDATSRSAYVLLCGGGGGGNADQPGLGGAVTWALMRVEGGERFSYDVGLGGLSEFRGGSTTFADLVAKGGRGGGVGGDGRGGDGTIFLIQSRGPDDVLLERLVERGMPGPVDVPLV